MDQRQSVLVRRLAGAAVLLLLAFGVSLILPDPSRPPGAEEGMERVELRIADGGVVAPVPQQPDTGKGQEAGASPPSSSLDMAASSEIDTPAPADDEPPADPPTEAAAPIPPAAVVPEPKPKPETPFAVAVVPPKPKPAPVPSVADVVAEKKPAEAAPTKPAPAPVTPPPEVASKPDVPAPVVNVPPTVVPPPASKPATASAWQIQAGSYADIGNARQVEDQLKALGYAATLSIVEAGGSARYRVRCGPFATRELAEAARKRLEQNRIPANLVAQGG